MRAESLKLSNMSYTIQKVSGVLVLFIACAVSLGCGGSVNLVASGIKGSCGSSDGAAFSAAPIVGLCSIGTATTVTGSGPWTWSCIEADGGGTATCAAITASAICSYSAVLKDGCPGAPAGTAQFPHMVDVHQVISLNILPGSGYTDGTYTWTASSGAATGKVTVSGGALGGPQGTSYTITNQGSGYTSRPTIAVPTGAGTGGSITPTVYQATPHNASSPWNVAGVDYYVGIPSGTVLKDPTVSSNLPTGASFSGQTVTVTGCNVTLDSFDFTLHPTALVINVTGTNCTTTVKDSKQQAVSNTLTYYPIVDLQNLGSGGAFVYEYNEYDGLAPYGRPPFSGSGYSVNAPICCTGNVTLMYNYFHNFDSKIIQMSGTTPSSPMLERYNLFAEFGTCEFTCAHGEAEYTYGASGTTVSFTGEYNTYYLPYYYGYDPATNAYVNNLSAPHAVNANTMNVNGTTDDHNVVLAQGPQPGSGCTTGTHNHTNYVASSGIFDGPGGGGLLSNMTFDHNYIDATGAYFAWYSGVPSGSITYTNNVDTITATACN